MHPFAMETVAILVHSLNRFSLCTKMAAAAVAKLLLCCDIICKRSIGSLALTSHSCIETLSSYSQSHCFGFCFV